MIYITGDTIGDIKRFDNRKLKKIKSDDTLIICGNFGFIWDDTKEEKKILKKLFNKKYTICFVDGKQENFDILNSYDVTEWNGGNVHKIGPNVYHLMRGQIYNIEDKTVFTMGGGESLDREDRDAAGKWWPEEMPTMDEMKTGVNNLFEVHKKVDYIITHEPASSIRDMLVRNPYYISPLGAYLEQLSKEIDYKKWFFGSLHIDRKLTSRNFAMFKDVIPIEATEVKKSWFKKG